MNVDVIADHVTASDIDTPYVNPFGFVQVSVGAIQLFLSSLDALDAFVDRLGELAHQARQQYAALPTPDGSSAAAVDQGASPARPVGGNPEDAA